MAPKLTRLASHFSLEEVAQHAVDWWLTTEDLPRPENRVTVDEDGNIHLAYEATNNEEADGLYEGCEPFSITSAWPTITC